MHRGGTLSVWESTGRDIVPRPPMYTKTPTDKQENLHHPIVSINQGKSLHD